MVSRRKKSTTVGAGADEGIRLSRLLLFAGLGIAGLVAIAMLVRMAFDRPRPRPARPSATAAEAPPPERVFLSSAPAPMPVALVVPHVESQTTELLKARGPDCLACAQRNGCLDAHESGGSCDDLRGEAPMCGPGVTERDVCYAALGEVFRSKCAETLQEAPCLCGATDIIGCMDGTATPTGPLYALYACDFKTQDAVVITRDFREGSYGAGVANSLVQCVAGYGCDCFGN
jgi:hypothetical protein